MADKAFNVHMQPLPEGYTPLEVVAVVKCLDREGEPLLCIRYSNGVDPWDASGWLLSALDKSRMETLGQFEWDAHQSEDPDV
jgi:hypothetical protein